VAGVVLSAATAAYSQRHHRRDLPSTQQQPTPEQRGTQQAPFVVQVQQVPDTQKEPERNGTQTPKQRDDGWFSGWSLSDRIAGIASAAGFLQFVALVATIWVMVSNGRRQLRAYIFLDGGALADGMTLNPPRPEHANRPGWVAVIKNSGQTPAYNVLTWAEIANQSTKAI
jgi:hypothetical protein